MRPLPFSFARPDNLDEAIALIEASDNAHFYAGGTELLLAMKLRVIQPDALIDLKRIEGLDDISMVDEATVSIGARATHARIEGDPIVAAWLPSLSSVCSNVANIRVRSTGTLGGNLCFGEPHADPPTLLAALGARLLLVGAQGNREIAADEFILDEYETAREPSEILLRILIPVPRGPVVYRRFRHGERPLVNAALVWEMMPDGKTIRRARFRVGALGPRPQPLRNLERALESLPVQDALQAAEKTMDDSLGSIEVVKDRHGSDDYKRHLAGVLMRRNIVEAIKAVVAS